jgi:hypothetical protein
MTMTQQCHGHAEVEGISILEEHFKEKMRALRTAHDPNRYDPQQKTMINVILSVKLSIQRVQKLSVTLTPYCNPIILHYNPKYIEVKMGESVSHMIGEEEFSIDLFNNLMRRLNQKNQRCTFTSKSTCNRHYFEAEFLVNISFQLQKQQTKL